MLEQDTESAWLELELADDTDAMPHLLGSSVSYRIAVGPQQGRKAFMIRTIHPLDRPDPGLERVAKAFNSRSPSDTSSSRPQAAGGSASGWLISIGTLVAVVTFFYADVTAPGTNIVNLELQNQ